MLAKLPSNRPIARRGVLRGRFQGRSCGLFSAMLRRMLASPPFRAERRLFPRRATQGAARLFWCHQDEPQSLDVVLRDRSESGIGLLYLRPREPLPVGQNVLLFDPNGTGCWGKSCYCQPREDHYLVGVELTRKGVRLNQNVWRHFASGLPKHGE